MLFEELPKELKEAVADLKYYSKTITCDLHDALEDAGNHEEFKELFRDRMLNIISEARDAVNRICGE